LAGLAAVALTLMWAPGAERALHAAAQTPAPARAVPPLDADTTPLTSQNIAGHRLWLILLDKTALQATDIERVTADAIAWSTEKTPNVDVVAVAVIGSQGLEVRQDFTSNDAKIRRALTAFGKEPSEAGQLSNDARSVGLRRLCEVLQAWPEKKEILSFTTTVIQGDPFLYRQAVDACEKANAIIETVDARGLHVGRGGGDAPAIQ
jgi:hypothetical protein